MRNIFKKIKDGLLTLGILGAASIGCFLLRDLLHTDNYISMVYTFAVFLIARFTKSVFYGVAASVISIFAINYVFTFPYFAFNFTLPGYLLTTICVLSITLATSTLTARIKRQGALRAQVEKEKMRANLLRAISHDLRTPLTTIHGSCCALLDTQETLSPKQRRELLLGICQDSEWLIRLVENLLSVTRITDAQSVRLHKTPEAAEEVLESACTKFAKRYPGIALSVQMPPQVLILPMDAVLIEQTVSNLLENAVLHGKSTTTISICVKQQHQEAVFEIADNGAGIASALLPNIFSDHIDRTDPDATRSMGIGLSVCRTIVEAHGGAISARNEPGGGAVFRFTLPMEESS